MKKPLNLPEFKSEDEERDFWENINLTDYFEANDFKPVSFPNLKPTSRAISIRLPEFLIDRIKEKANAMGVPYQSLIKQTLHQTFLLKDSNSKK